MDNKRTVSILIPLKKTGDSLEVYLQKHSKDAERLPNYFGFWGGGAEGNESPEQVLQREIKEEMGIDLDLTKVKRLSEYEFLRSIKHVFYFEPEDGWKNFITIGEGDYGKWFRLEDALNARDIIFEDKVVLNDLERVLLNRSIK